MAKGLPKITVACPSCHATQQEPEHVRSTFCRKCGKHIDLGARAKASPSSKPEGAGLMDRLNRMLHREQVRQINCLYCSAPQKVSSLASSGSCVQCGHYLDFRDFKIDGNFSKSIETHGTLTITKTGELTSPRVACTSALIIGKLNGNLVCSTSAHVRTRGRMIGSIEARQLIIDRQADAEFVRPLHVGTAEINGKISARIFADSVLINKHGSLEGAVTAKSIQIERGGIFHGDLIIGQHKEEQGELPLAGQPRPRPKRRDLGGGNSMLLRPAT